MIECKSTIKYVCKNSDKELDLKKTLFVCGLLILGYTQYSYAKDQPEFIETVELNRKTNSLEFKDILKGIYAQKIVNNQHYDSEGDFKPYAKTVFYDVAAQEQQLVLMHPVVSYKNSAGEVRYFVLLEKLTMSSTGFIKSCNACSAKADFLIFKKQESGGFYLINYQLNVDDLPGGAGRLKLDIKQIRKNMQPVGKDIIGSYFIGYYTGAGGEAGSEWYSLFLPEQGKIQVVEIGMAGHDSSSFYADRPEHTSVTTSILKILPNDQSYYPIEIIYKTLSGEKEKATFEKSHFIFDSKTNVYIEKKLENLKN